MEDEVARSVTDDLVGELHVTGLRVPNRRRRELHDLSLVDPVGLSSGIESYEGSSSMQRPPFHNSDRSILQTEMRVCSLDRASLAMLAE